ncbi:Proteinase inhibitor [Salinispira pacifica]|uniref:Proteinase inhibitor n=2 Tax=Salinispira pacifica TaxID=1307761 RepID=V5WI11_9SPIO|nr:Proteinase inhibitor [Salinispira pacifica]
MPRGKPAGVPCINLDENLNCRIHGTAEYPVVCRNLQPRPDMCGESRDQALRYLTRLEQETLPPSS